MANRSVKKPVGMRLSEDAVSLLKTMADQTGISQTGIVELAIREKAKREGLALQKGMK